MFEASPGLHRGIQAMLNDRLEGLQALGDAAFAGAIVADEDGQGREADGAAIADGFEMFEAEGPEKWCAHRTSPRSASR